MLSILLVREAQGQKDKGSHTCEKQVGACLKGIAAGVAEVLGARGWGVVLGGMRLQYLFHQFTSHGFSERRVQFIFSGSDVCVPQSQRITLLQTPHPS